MIKFGIIGCGRIGNRHAEHINNFGVLAAVCDIDESKAKALASAYNCPYFTDIDEMLSANIDMEVASICSPNGLHAEHSIKALNSGFHALCEKPLATSILDAGEMIKASERNNKRLFAIKQNRFNPPVAKVKELIDEGLLGTLFNVQLSCFWNRNEDYYLNSWKGTNELDGGTLFTQFSHFIDLLYWMMGDFKSMKGFSNNYMHEGITDFEDTGVVAIEFYNGAVGTINYTVNSHAKNMEGSITLFGTKGTVKIGGQYLNELEYQSIEGLKISGLPEGNKANSYGTYQGSMSNHDSVYKNVIDVLQNGAVISTNSFEALKTVEIIERIYNEIR